MIRGKTIGNATLLEWKQVKDGYIVLCLHGRDYVTWWYDGDKCCAYGHYTDNLKAAMSDFEIKD